MIDSILNSVKKNLGLAADYNAFDDDILLFINGVLFHLTQLGVGPEVGFTVEDADDTWDDFLGSQPRWNGVRTFVFLRVRMLFDPPQTSYLISALEKQALEMEWRILAERERTDWTHPSPVTVPITDNVIDGGSP